MNFVPTAVTAFITAFATLSGIFITNKANNDRLAKQLEHEEKLKQREFMREKLEELYCLSKQWTTNLSNFYLGRTSAMAGHIDYIELIEKELEQNNEKVDFYRVEMLIDLYFPHLRSAYNEFIKARSQVNEIALRYEADYRKGDKDGKKLVPSFLKAQDNFDEEIDKFIKLISEQQKYI